MLGYSNQHDPHEGKDLAQWHGSVSTGHNMRCDSSAALHKLHWGKQWLCIYSTDFQKFYEQKMPYETTEETIGWEIFGA